MAIQTRPLGRTGANVTILGYGAMELRGQPRGPAITDDEAGRLLGAVLDSGINLIDTSVDYGHSEELIGRYLGHRRDEYFLASKCGCPLSPPPDATPPYQHDYSAGNVRADIEQSLRRLRTDRLDLVQVHMSPSHALMEAEHTVETLQSVRDEGKVRFIGMSGILPNLPDHIAMGVFEVFQIPYSAVQREHEELITAAAGTGAGTLIRGGAARGAPADDKAWRHGPLGLDQGVGQRRWETSGVGRTARRHEPDRVRAPVHAESSGPVQHDRRHVQRRSPARQRGHGRKGTAPGGPVRRSQAPPGASRRVAHRDPA